MRARPLPRTFRSGELAPWLDGITNEITQQGCRTLENFIVRKQGQALRRPGTFFVNEVKDSADTTVLVPITIDDDNSYVLELGDAYIRFYKNHARITYAGTTTIYEVTSPWSTGDVSDLRWAYIPDEKSLYFAHPDYAMRKLAWTSDASWALNVLDILSTKIIIALDIMGRTYLTDDLENWDRGNIPVTFPSLPASVARIGAGKNVYCAIFQVSGSNHLFISENCKDWVEIAVPDQFPRNITGNRHGELVYMGSGTIWASTDKGMTWGAKTTPTSLPIYDAVFDYSENAWRAVGANCDMYSKDLVSWVSIAELSITQYAYAIDSNDAGLYVVAGEMVSGGSVGYGFIAKATSIASPLVVKACSITNYFNSIAYGEPDASPLWVVAGVNGTTYISSIAETWVPVSFTTQTIRKVLWVHSKFMAFGGDQTYWISEKGTSWTTLTEVIFPSDAAKPIQDVIFYEEDDFEWFSKSDHYPKQMTYHEGRLVLGATDTEPATLWGSKTAKLENFYLGEFANEGWSYKLSGERNVDIQWMMGNMGGLVVGTRTAEGILLGSQEEGITPQTAQFRWLSTFGSANIQPVRSNNFIIFVQRGGEIVRGYVPQANAYESPELTCFADHITKGGVLSIDRQEDPQNIIYFVRTDGQLPALSFEKQTVAWSRIKTASTSLSVGIIESIAVIPTIGAEDEVWQVVNRKVAAGTMRCIEYYDQLAVSSLADAHYVDCGVNPTSSVTFQTVGALTHLAGEVIDALVDGTRWISGLTVAAAGTIAVSPYSGTNIHAGLPVPYYLQTMRGDYGSPWGDGAGLNKRTSDLLVWVHDSASLAKFGPNTTLATETIVYSSSTTLVTEIVKVNFPGQWDRDNYIWITGNDPWPLTIVAMIPDSETGSR